MKKLLLSALACFGILEAWGVGHKISLVPGVEFGWSQIDNNYVYKPGHAGGSVGLGYRFLPWGDGRPSFGLYGGFGISYYVSADYDHITDGVDEILDSDFDNITTDDIKNFKNLINDSRGGVFYATSTYETFKFQFLHKGNTGLLVDLGARIYKWDSKFHNYSVDYRGKREFYPYVGSTERSFVNFLAGLGYSSRHFQIEANVEMGQNGFDNVSLGMAVPITLAYWGKGKRGIYENMYTGKPYGIDSTKVYHLSGSFHIGGNMLSGCDDNSNPNPQFGLDLLYSFNPLWGLGIDYSSIFNYQHYYNNVVHAGAVFAEVNFANMLAKYRSAGWQRFNAYGRGGFGLGYYTYDCDKHKSERDCDLTSIFALGGLTLEYNISNAWALGLGGQIRHYTNSDFHPACDGFKTQFLADLSFRYKFGEARNVRNMPLTNFEPKVELPDYTPQLQAQIAQMQLVNDSLSHLILAQGEQMAALDSLISLQKDSLARHIRSTRPAQRFQPKGQDSAAVAGLIASLNFDNDKIKADSYDALDSFADLLQKNKLWSVVFKVYTDNSGKAYLKADLARKRASALKAYFVNKGVSAARLQTYGYISPAGNNKGDHVEVELFSK